MIILVPRQPLSDPAAEKGPVWSNRMPILMVWGWARAGCWGPESKTRAPTSMRAKAIRRALMCQPPSGSACPRTEDHGGGKVPNLSMGSRGGQRGPAPCRSWAAGNARKAGPLNRDPAFRVTLGALLGLANVGGLEPLRALGHLELDLIALGQALEALGLNGVEMHEHVLATLLGNEAIPLRIVEPLDCTLCHRPLPLSVEAFASVKPRHHGGGVLPQCRTNENAAGLEVLAALISTFATLLSATNRLTG